MRDWFEVVEGGEGRGRWDGRIVGYNHELLDRDGRTVVAYHWHPTGPRSVTAPHLHVGCRTPSVDRSKARLTSHVSLVAVVRVAISELDVEPLRADWREVLDQAVRGPTA